MSNNSTEGVEERLHVLTGSHQRTAYSLELEINYLAEKWGINFIGVLTLTIGGSKPPCIQDFSKRFNSLRTHVIRHRYVQSVWVVERGGKKDRLHMHGVVVSREDLRTNAAGNGPVDFAAFKRDEYLTAGPHLRSEWAFWRKTAPLYGFGRTSLEPVKCPGEVLGRYFGKYIGKQVEHRVKRDKGARLVRYVGFAPGERIASSRFGWNNDNAIVWRAKVAVWASSMGLTEETIVERCGPRWAFVHHDAIMMTKLPADFVWPSEEAYFAAEGRERAYVSKVETARRETAASRQSTMGRTVLLQPRTNYEQTPY